MSVGRICTRVVATAAPDETVREIARRMSEHDVGTLVVVGEVAIIGQLLAKQAPTLAF